MNENDIQTTDTIAADAMDTGSPYDTHTTPVAAYPVTDTILRGSDGEPYAAFGNAKAGPRTITYQLGYRYELADREVIMITIREKTTPRNAAEEGSVVALNAPIAEAYCYGSFHAALSIGRSMCGGYAARLAARTARNAAKKARRRAQNAPDAPDAENTHGEASERA